MKVKINSSWQELDEENQLIAILKKLSLEEKTGIAVAVNSSVIPKREWHQFTLHENDEVIIIEAIQGG